MLNRGISAAIAVTCLMSAQTARAESFYYHGSTIDVAPLAGSEWAIAHKGQLPYEKCFITAPDGLNTDRTDVLVYGVSHLQRTEDEDKAPRLVCYSRTLKLGFMLPIGLDSTDHAGLLAHIMMGEEVNDSMSVSKLDGKTVSMLFGNYKGFEASLSALFGFSGQIMTNPYGVKIKNAQGLAFAIGVSAGYVQTSILRRTHYYSIDGSNLLMLVNGTELPRTMTDWYTRVEHTHPNDPVRFHIDTTVDYSNLDDLRFVKIK